MKVGVNRRAGTSRHGTRIGRLSKSEVDNAASEDVAMKRPTKPHPPLASFASSDQPPGGQS